MAQSLFFFTLWHPKIHTISRVRLPQSRAAQSLPWTIWCPLSQMSLLAAHSYLTCHPPDLCLQGCFLIPQTEKKLPFHALSSCWNLNPPGLLQPPHLSRFPAGFAPCPLCATPNYSQQCQAGGSAVTEDGSRAPSTTTAAAGGQSRAEKATLLSVWLLSFISSQAEGRTFSAFAPSFPSLCSHRAVPENTVQGCYALVKICFKHWKPPLSEEIIAPLEQPQVFLKHICCRKINKERSSVRKAVWVFTKIFCLLVPWPEQQWKCKHWEI